MWLTLNIKGSTMQYEFEMLDMEQLFHSIPNKTVISSDTDYSDEMNRDMVISDIINTVDTARFDTFARCKCGALQGNYLENRLCRCGSKALKDDITYRPNAWYSVTEAEDFKFMHPYFYVAIDDYFNTRKVAFLNFISGKNTPSTKKYVALKETLATYQNLDTPIRTTEWFKENWLGFFEVLTKEDEYTNLKHLINYFKDREHLLYTTKIALPSKRFLTVEKSKKSTFAMVKRLKRIVDIHLYAGTDKYQELDYVNMEIGTMYRTIGVGGKGIISSKQGLVRHNVGSGSINYGFRAPITLMNGMDKALTDVIHIPYSVGMTVFKYHIMNRMIRAGIPIIKTRARLARAVRNFDEELYNMLAELVTTANQGRGFKCTLQRNPTQGQQAIQPMYIQLVKPDPYITSVSVCDITCEGTNGDIDGELT